MTTPASATAVQAVRAFNRFYTKHIGVLNEGLLDSPFSLTNVRVLYEVANTQQPTAAAIGKTLAIDPGYLSRILRDFKRQGLIETRPSETDARQMIVSLTATGVNAFAALNARSDEEILFMLEPLSDADRLRLVHSMQVIQQLLDRNSPRAAQPPYLLRPHQPGDMGWVVYRHGVLYSQEYGWDERFEALVAGVVAKFIEHFDRKRERCWIAEIDGEPVGSVFLVKHSETIAKLRLLLVEPKARGLGIGARLVAETIRFARQAGYRKVILWTNSVLHAARHLYENAGFRLVTSEPHDSFGEGLIAETWELKL